MRVGLCFFGCTPSGGPTVDDYRLLLEGARFADRQGLSSVWTPERHYHPFGGMFPNPAVAASAVAGCTSRVGLRAGSVVLPIHDPLPVAEDWALVDALSGGRVGVSFASGWHDQDFLLSPGTYEARRQILWERIDEVRRLWRGESVTRTGRDGRPVEVRIQPRPVQAELPVWITAAGTEATFERAGREGFHVFTHLLGMDFGGLRGRIATYRQARAAAGRDPSGGEVTLMIHTHLGPGPGPDGGGRGEAVRAAMKTFLGHSLGLIQEATTPWAFGAYRQGVRGAQGAEVTGLERGRLGEADREAILERSADRFLGGLGLFGTVDQATAVAAEARSVGVDELACLIDFGLEAERVLEGLPAIAELQERVRADPPVAPRRTSSCAGIGVAPAGEGRSGTGGSEAGGTRPECYDEIREIWCSVLGLAEAGPESDFFDSGGHSLHATRFANRIRTRWGCELPLGALFDRPTLLGIAEEVARRVRTGRGKGG